jgi:hypothetical protein
MSDRFSPDEALHIIHDVLTFCGKRHPTGHPFDDGTTVLPRGDVETIQNQVRSLRAYLAGRMDAAPQDVHPNFDTPGHFGNPGLCPVCGPAARFPSSQAAESLSRDAIAALKQEAENAPDTPGIADWGRKAVLRLIASHEELRESIAVDWAFCHIGCPYAAKAVGLKEMQSHLTLAADHIREVLRTSEGKR